MTDCILSIPDYKMVVICFPGGAGGHYIGYLVQHLLNQTPCEDLAQVNFHQMFKGNRSFLNFSFLDQTGHSQEEELSYIQQIQPTDSLVLGHFRNASAIYQQHQSRIVCVRVGNHTKDLLADRVIREAIDHNFDQVKYTDIRGTAWPDINPGYACMPKWIQLEIQSMLHRMFEYWNAGIDCSGVDPKNLCEISSDAVFGGDAVETLSTFLQCDPVPGMRQTQQQYQQLVQQKYNYLPATASAAPLLKLGLQGLLA
jgi:hypothetical protein